MNRRQLVYQIICGILNGAIGLALGLLAWYLGNGAWWTALVTMVLSCGMTLGGMIIGNEIYLRRLRAEREATR